MLQIGTKEDHMSAPRLTLSDELAEIRAEIARLRRREVRLQALADNMPAVSVFRPGWPINRTSTTVPVNA